MAKKRDKGAAVVNAAAPEPQPVARETPEAPADPAPQAAPETEITDVAGCCGEIPPGPEPVVTRAAQAIAPESPGEGAVLMKFVGNYTAPVTYLGLYAGCVTCAPVWVDPGHVARLEGTGAWARVEASA